MNHPGSTFHAMLFSKEEIQLKADCENLVIDNKIYFYCGDHATAQFWFVISSSGEICTYDNALNLVYGVASPFEKFIENYAMEDWLERDGIY
jgi:hypothetical protein